MITIFCDFLNNQCYHQNFEQFSFVLSQKRNFFAEFFGENMYLKNHNICPRLRFLLKMFLSLHLKYLGSMMKLYKDDARDPCYDFLVTYAKILGEKISVFC
jgi:hypothetical protein